jgi:hypothetical protein
VRTVDEAIDLAVKAEHGFRHTAGIYSRNVDTITRMARAMNCSIFVANARPSPASARAARASLRSRSPRRPARADPPAHLLARAPAHRRGGLRIV